MLWKVAKYALLAKTELTGNLKMLPGTWRSSKLTKRNDHMKLVNLNGTCSFSLKATKTERLLNHPLTSYPEFKIFQCLPCSCWIELQNMHCFEPKKHTIQSLVISHMIKTCQKTLYRVPSFSSNQELTMNFWEDVQQSPTTWMRWHTCILLLDRQKFKCQVKYPAH